MSRKVFKLFLFFLVVLLFVFLIIDQHREVYCISEDKCVTVWKRIGGTCYIVPYKYYGIFKPINNYIVTTNSSNIGIIWKNSKEVIAQIDEESTIINDSNDDIKILNYKANNKVYDSLYTYKDGHYLKYKKDVQYISISILENYVMTDDGR